MRMQVREGLPYVTVTLQDLFRLEIRHASP